MMVCYLDDSGTDTQSPVLTMAGYAGLQPYWAAFEQSAATIFADFGVTSLHAHDLNGTKGQFKGWPRKRKEAFIARLISELKKAALFGMMASITKTAYAKAKGVGEHTQESPYGHCFGKVLDSIMWSAHMKSVASKGGTLSLIVESGNKNDTDVTRVFNKAKWDPRNVGVERVLKSVEFVDKTSSIALQIADFLAFTGRRLALHSERERKYLPLTDLQKVTLYSIPIAHSHSHTFLTNEEIAAGIKDPNMWRNEAPWLDQDLNSRPR
jgi:hypothetical protein